MRETPRRPRKQGPAGGQFGAKSPNVPATCRLDSFKPLQTKQNAVSLGTSEQLQPNALLQSLWNGEIAAISLKETLSLISKVAKDNLNFSEEKTEDFGKEWDKEIETRKDEVAELMATIVSKASLLASLDSKMERLVGEMTTDEADLKAATEICTKEASEFAALEK